MVPPTDDNKSETHSTSLPESVDVIIAGAGLTGASCFYHLARDTDLNILGLEAKTVNHGSTARSAAAFRHQFASRVNIQMSLFSGREYETFPEEIGGDSVFMQNGYLFLYSDPDLFQKATQTAQKQQEHGVSVEVLDPDQVQEQFPYLDTSGLAGATWGKRDGYIRPEQASLSYIRAAFREQSDNQHLQLEQRSPITNVVTKGDSIHSVVIDEHQEVQTDVLLNTAGIWGLQIAQFAGVSLPVLPMKRYLYFTNQFQDRNVESFGMHVFNLGQYARPEHNGLMLGWDQKPEKPDSFDSYWEQPENFEDLYMLQDQVEKGFGLGVEGYGYEILAEVAKRMPFLVEEAGLENVSSGYYQVTPDEKAIIDWDPRVDGLLHALGFSGHGVMHAPATGRAVTDLVLDQSSPFDLEDLQLANLLENQTRHDPEQMVI